jgi:hypothetical protein
MSVTHSPAGIGLLGELSLPGERSGELQIHLLTSDTVAASVAHCERLHSEFLSREPKLRADAIRRIIEKTSNWPG